MNQNEDLKPQLTTLKPGDVEIGNSLNLLMKEGYIVDSSVGLLITSKLTRFYSQLINRQTPSSTSINIPTEKITLKDFKDKAEIPWHITTNKGTAKEFTYNTGQISLRAEKYFNSKVVGKCDMNLLIELTKAYYKDESVARPTLSNYFLNGIWEGVLKEYKPKNQVQVANQSFTGERRL